MEATKTRADIDTYLIWNVSCNGWFPQTVNPFWRKVFQKVWQEILLKHPEVKFVTRNGRRFHNLDFIKESIYDLRTNCIDFMQIF